MKYDVRFDIAGKTMSIETGHIAKQANGAVMVRLEDTMILAAVVGEKESKDERDFLPMSVEYREKAYAAGKIPGGFFKRESRPGEKEILSARQIDRPLRPLFPEGYRNQIQIVIFVLSSDQENDADILGLIGAATALNLSDLPFDTPVAAVRVGRINGEYIINPSFSDLVESDMDIVVAGTEESIVMIEGGAVEVPEDDIIEGVSLAHDYIKQIVEKEKELVAKAGKPKWEYIAPKIPEEITEKVRALATTRIVEVNDRVLEKHSRSDLLKGILEEIQAELEETFPECEKQIGSVFHEIEKETMRRSILEKGKRADGRDPGTIRPIECEVGILPRTHGSALFTRGETQSLTAVTLGTKTDEQRVDDLEGESRKSYMLHYNFPSFSVGEVRPFRGPARREIGHGVLAERAISPVIPEEEHFPYTVRLVTDILESNGSSSMATVCGGSLALMDAGVPIKAPVAGVAMGLVMDDEKRVVLTDILGAEDHLGDMDLKLAGTYKGATAVQMDIKIKGVDVDLLKNIFERAREARLDILKTMDQTIARPREEISTFAPKIFILQIDQEKIGGLIGPGGKNIRRIIQETETDINIEDDGRVTISAKNLEDGEKALEIIKSMTEDVEVGKTYKGFVTRITSFGAFVDILPGKEGLVHISELEHYRVRRVEDVLNKGDEVMVKVIGIDDQGRIKLSRKELLEPPAGGADSGNRDDRDRGDRGGGRQYSQRSGSDRGGYRSQQQRRR